MAIDTEEFIRRVNEMLNGVSPIGFHFWRDQEPFTPPYNAFHPPFFIVVEGEAMPILEYNSIPSFQEASGRMMETASAMRHPGEICASLYAHGIGEWTVEFNNELRDLDYSPVMDVFLQRELDRVTYEHEHDSFVFMFKNPASALKFSRRHHCWHIIDALGVNTRNRILKPAWVIGGTIPPSGTPLTAMFPDGILLTANGGISGLNALSTTATPDQCTYCQTTFYHPPFNNKLTNCPNCGAPATLFVSSGSALPMPSPPSQAIPQSAPLTNFAPAVSMRCPGGCGSEIMAHGEHRPIGIVGGRIDEIIISSCKYSCKVRIDLWKKKFDEAKKQLSR